VNVLEMVDACEAGFEQYPLLIQRDSWAPRTMLEVIGVSPDWKHWPGSAPYWSNAPRVFGWLFSRGEYQLVEVSCPSTYAYKRVVQPVWWFPPALGTCKLGDGQTVVIE
jgi:hypothetical protein